MVRRPGKQTAEAAEVTRRRLLEAALKRFAEKGFQGASLREIAEDAEITHGLIRHHFGSKDDLWRAVVDDFVGKFEKRHRPLLSGVRDTDPVELLMGLATNFVHVSAQLPEMSKIIMNDCSVPGPRLDYVMERMRPIHNAIVPIFHSVQERGLLKHHDADTFFVFLFMIGSIPFSLRGFTNTFYRTDICTKEGIDRHCELVLKTLFER